MTRRTLLMTLLLVAMTMAMSPPVAWADDDRDGRKSVTVSFGAGLNTAQQGNAANHHVLPRVIEVDTGGVVNFVVAGFHQIFAYNPGTRVSDVEDYLASLPSEPTFINYLTNTYYQGLSPVGPPPTGLSNAQNRVESVSFSKPGLYLVLCNVTGHFKDGMWAWVRVGVRGHGGHD
jgi:hypothetical protein